MYRNLCKHLKYYPDVLGFLILVLQRSYRVSNKKIITKFIYLRADELNKPNRASPKPLDNRGAMYLLRCALLSWNILLVIEHTTQSEFIWTHYEEHLRSQIGR